MRALDSTKKLELIYHSITGKIVYPEHCHKSESVMDSPIVFVSNCAFKNKTLHHEIYIVDLRLGLSQSIRSTKQFEENLPRLCGYFQNKRCKLHEQNPESFFSYRYEYFLNQVMPRLKEHELKETSSNFVANMDFLASSAIFEKHYAENLKTMFLKTCERIKEAQSEEAGKNQ